MSLKDLAGKELGEWSGFACDCGCGRRHELKTQFFIKSGAEEEVCLALEKIVPSGCGVLLLHENGFDAGEPGRIMRRGGYTVHPRPLERNADFARLESMVVPEDVRAIVGMGGGFIADCCKYIAAFLSLPCAVVVRAHTSASLLVPSAAIDGGGMPQLFKTCSPSLIICDPDKLPLKCSYNAAAFGSIASRLTALFDWKFSALIRGEKLCKAVYEAALSEIDSVINRLKGATREERGVKEVLLESGLRISALAALGGSSRLLSGGDTACALALQMLFKHEDRKCRLQGENEFLFSLILFEAYKKLFAARRGDDFLPPPDNNLRLEKLQEFFGVGENAAAGGITPYVPSCLMQLYDYRIDEYESDLKNELAALSSRLHIAHRIFKRLHGDDGFSLRTYLAGGDAKLCLALAPEMRAKYTALTHLKNMGITDAYLD